MLRAPEKSHGGLSGRGAHWGEASGLQGGIAALRELRNVAFLAGLGPPATPQLRHMSHFRKRKRRLFTRPSQPGWEFFRASKFQEGGQLLSGDCALGRVGAFAGPNFGATGPKHPGTMGAKWLPPPPPPVEDAGSHRAATHLRAGGMVAGESRNGEAGRVAAERLGDLCRPILEVREISRAALVILRQTAADFRAEFAPVGALRRAAQVAADELG